MKIVLIVCFPDCEVMYTQSSGNNSRDKKSNMKGTITPPPEIRPELLHIHIYVSYKNVKYYHTV